MRLSRSLSLSVLLAMLAGCGSVSLPERLGGGPSALYKGSARSVRGIEADVTVVRNPEVATTCTIDVEFINDTREESRFMTLALRAFDTNGTLARMELVRSSSIRPGGHNRVKVQDTGLCTLSDRQISEFTVELY